MIGTDIDGTAYCFSITHYSRPPHIRQGIQCWEGPDQYWTKDIILLLQQIISYLSFPLFFLYFIELEQALLLRQHIMKSILAASFQLTCFLIGLNFKRKLSPRAFNQSICFKNSKYFKGYDEKTKILKICPFLENFIPFVTMLLPVIAKFDYLLVL